MVRWYMTQKQDFIEWPKRATYTREEVDYTSWYSEWSKRLAKTKSLQDLFGIYWSIEHKREGLRNSHHNAISKSTSMTSNSQHRAQTKNAMLGNMDYYFAVLGAIEIYELFPEETDVHL